MAHQSPYYGQQTFHYGQSPSVYPVPPAFPYQYGGATRPPAPKVYPVVIITLVVGLFGIIAAALSGNQASKLGYSQKPYWIAWAVTFVCVLSAWVLLLGAVGASGVAMDAAELERSILEDSLWSDGTRATSASCSIANTIDDGSGYYRCRITDSSGFTGTYLVTVEPDGAWNGELIGVAP